MNRNAFRILAGMVASAACLLTQLPAGAADADGDFKPMFNGKDLTGWDGDPILWSAKNGEIIGQTTVEHPAAHNTFLIWTNSDVGDFELRCQYKITSQNDKGFANSGIQYRSKIIDPKGWVVGGYQADMEAGSTYSGILYEERMTRGIMAQRGEKVVFDTNCVRRVVGTLGDSKEIQAAIKKDDWNDYRILVEGHHLQHWINGHQTIDVTDECASKRAMKGVLALQLHAGGAMKVEFRDLKIKMASGRHASAGSTEKSSTKTATGPAAPLQGSWQVAELEAEGSVVSKDLLGDIYLTIIDHDFRILNLGDDVSGNFKLDTSTKPGHIDIHCETGPDKGQTWPGIYEVGGENFKVCYSRLGKKRPMKFATKSDPGLVMINYVRKKV